MLATLIFAKKGFFLTTAEITEFGVFSIENSLLGALCDSAVSSLQEGGQSPFRKGDCPLLVAATPRRVSVVKTTSQETLKNQNHNERTAETCR